MSARRYNKGKLRYSLIPHEALSQIAEVYTKGAHKYSIYKDKDGNIISGKDISLEDAINLELIENGDNNWRSGQLWLETADSAIRHIESWKSGIDIDPDLGTPHLANAVCNIMSLLTYSKIYKQGDNRVKHIFINPRVGYDLDSVLADFNPYIHEKFGIKRDLNEIMHWKDHIILEYFEKIKYNKDFWLNVPVLTDSKDIYFEPKVYITSREIDEEVSKEWLKKNNFPFAPVVNTNGRNKYDIAKEYKLDFFIDDAYENFAELNNNGIKCFLFDQPYNRKYNVGDLRIKNMKEFNEKLLK